IAWMALPLVQPPQQAADGALAEAPIVPVAASVPPPAAAEDEYLLAHLPFSHPGAAQPADLAGSGWIVRSLPPGFRTGNEMTRTLGGAARVGHIVLSDGRTAISVFIEPLREPVPAPGLVRRGATSIYTRQLGSYRITVVGEAPPESVKYVADAVELRK